MRRFLHKLFIGGPLLAWPRLWDCGGLEDLRMLMKTALYELQDGPKGPHFLGAAGSATPASRDGLISPGHEWTPCHNSPSNMSHGREIFDSDGIKSWWFSEDPQSQQSPQVDGSCYLKLTLNVSLGLLSLPGHPDTGLNHVEPPEFGGNVSKAGWKILHFIGFFPNETSVYRWCSIYSQVEPPFQDISRLYYICDGLNQPFKSNWGYIISLHHCLTFPHFSDKPFRGEVRPRRLITTWVVLPWGMVINPCCRDCTGFTCPLQGVPSTIYPVFTLAHMGSYLLILNQFNLLRGCWTMLDMDKRWWKPDRATPDDQLNIGPVASSGTIFELAHPTKNQSAS